jgi:hypothetical protein
MKDCLIIIAAGIGFCLFAYSGAFFGAIGWHAGRVCAARKYGPIRTASENTYTVINKTGKPL